MLLRRNWRLPFLGIPHREQGLAGSPGRVASARGRASLETRSSSCAALLPPPGLHLLPFLSRRLSVQGLLNPPPAWVAPCHPPVPSDPDPTQGSLPYSAPSATWAVPALPGMTWAAWFVRLLLCSSPHWGVFHGAGAGSCGALLQAATQEAHGPGMSLC